MSVSYKKLQHILIDREISNSQLMRLANISANIITKFKNGQYIALDKVESICNALECTPNEILVFIPDEENAKGAGMIKPYIQSLSEIEQYIYELVEDELSYEKDFITNEGWNIIENIAPIETIKYIKEFEDITEITVDDIHRVFCKMLNQLEPSCGYRQPNN